MPPTYYRGCWHIVRRGLFLRYRHLFRPVQKKFTIRKPSSFTRRCWVRLAPIAQYSPLLPPVGVWAVSQSQCGRSTSQSGYQSSPWWAVTSPTSSLDARPSFSNKSLIAMGCPIAMLCGISTSFDVLSPTERQVPHALLTRPPLSIPIH